MPVPTSIDELSLVASSNFPLGTELPSVLDDSLRAHASFIAKLRDTSNALAKGITSSLTNMPIGALDFSAPGSYDRTLTQYNGTAYTGFNLKVDKLTVNGVLDLNSTGAQLTSDATQTVLYGDSGANYLQFYKPNRSWYIVVDGVPRAVLTPSEVLFTNQVVRRVGATDLYETQERTGNATDGKIWKTITNANGQLRFLVNDADSIAYFHDEIFRSGTQITTRRLLNSSGRLLVGQNITDDGTTALQTGSLKATTLSLTAQPGIRDCSGSSATMSGGNSGPLNLSIFTATGGMTINSNGSIICRVTAPLAGRYQFTVQIKTSMAPAIGTFVGELYAVLNGGSATVLANKILAISSDGIRYTSVTFIQYMQAGDYIHFNLVDSGPSGYPAVVGVNALDVQKIN